jgi:hypothetical protein
MLYLVRKNNQGEPVGVHNEAGESAYKRGSDYFRADSRQRMDKDPSQSWEDFCEQKATSFNPISNWSTVDQPETEIHELLSQVVSKVRYADSDQ